MVIFILYWEAFPLTTKKTGSQTVTLACPPSFAGHANVVGKKEGEGPLASSFDYIGTDDTFGESTWEKSESAMQKQALALALNKAGQPASNIDWLFAGYLLNQCIGSSFAARGQEIPFLGLYGACSTMGEGLALASMTLDGGFGEWAGVVVSSHFCTAERQYRTPLEYGGQRTPTAQWTTTAAGAAILAREGPGPYITHVTVGKIVDKGITDTNNMGAAMAPAAYDTISTHLKDTGRAPSYYDLIVTGDLGNLGSELLLELLRQDGLERVLYFDFSCVNELGDIVQLTLAMEIMGRYFNLILIDETGKVVDSMKRVDATMSSKRLVLPGLAYEMPPRDERLNFLQASPEQMLAVLSTKTGELSKALLQTFEGVSPVLVREHTSCHPYRCS